MMQKSLNEFCGLISLKYQNYENINFNSLNILSNYFEPNFFEKKISEFYKDFYLSKDIEKLKTVYGISNKTKNFECLLNKFNDDIKYRNLLEKIGNKLLEFANQNNDTSYDEILSSFYSMIHPVNEEEISFNYYDCCDSVEPTNISNQ